MKVKCEDIDYTIPKNEASLFLNVLKKYKGKSRLLDKERIRWDAPDGDAWLIVEKTRRGTYVIYSGQFRSVNRKGNLAFESALKGIQNKMKWFDRQGMI